MSTVLRFLFVIPFGFVAACYAAAFALLWPFLDLAPGAFHHPLALFELGIGFTAQAAQVGSAVLVPWAVLMMLTEILVLPSILLHVGAGAAGGFALARAWYGDGAPAAIQVALLVAGLAFMLVYWIVAGRRAGHWRRGRSPNPSAQGHEP